MFNEGILRHGLQVLTRRSQSALGTRQSQEPAQSVDARRRPACSRAVHDASTDVGAAVAAFCVVATACIYTSEVVARYFLNAPLNWSGDVSSYLLCACTFLALPKVTRRTATSPSATFVERMQRSAPDCGLRACSASSPASSASRRRSTSPSRAPSCSCSSVLTTQATRIPKWPIALLACFGFGSAALHLFFPREVAVQKDAAV